MKTLLDTTVISQLAKERTASSILDWFTNTPASNLYLSVVTLYELRVGIELLNAGKRKTALSRWLEEDVREEYRNRTLVLTPAIADRAGRLVIKLRMEGWNGVEMNCLIAMTALEHGLAVATSNKKDSERMGVRIAVF